MKKDNNSHKKYISINTEFFFSLEGTTEKNAYMTYLSLLLKFNNNIIKNATAERICSLTGISRNSWFKYQQILLKYNLIKKSNKDLVVIPQEKENKKHYTVFHLYRSLKVEHIEEIIVLDLINRNNEKQKYFILLKDSVQEFPRTIISKQQQLKFVKAYKRNKLSGEIDYQIKTSYRSMKEQSNYSLGKIHKLTNQLKSKNIIKTKKALKLIKRNSSFEELLIFSKTFQENTGRYIQLYFAPKTKRLYQVIGTSITTQEKSKNYIVANRKQIQLNTMYNTINEVSVR